MQVMVRRPARLPPSQTALLLIDVVNPFDFPGAERLRLLRILGRDVLKARVAPARSLRFGRRSARRRPARLAAAQR